jgi:hypothetical protein
MSRPPTAFSSRFLMDGEPAGSVPVQDVQQDRYQIRSELGQGGMGVVYLAHDRVLNRDVALKRPRADLPDAVRKQVMREAALTARLPHPAIAPVLDAAEDEHGFYYTMPVLVGVPLHHAALGVRSAVQAVARASEALGFAHTRGVVHRDVKPENILLGEHGEVWMLDWGVALDPQQPHHGIVGTRGYAAPEQERGDVVGPAADVFALGRTLAAVVDPLPDELESVVRRATVPEPSGRYADATEVAAELDAWLEGQRVEAHAYRATEVLRRWATHYRWPLAIAVTGLVGIGASITWGLSAQLAEFARAEAALASSLAIRANAERAAGHRAEAEWLAAESLTHGRSPIALGVLSAWPSENRPVRTSFWSPPCEGRLSKDAFVCVEADSVTAWRDGEPIASAPLIPPWPEVEQVDAAVWTPETGFRLQWGSMGIQTASAALLFPDPQNSEFGLFDAWGVRGVNRTPLYRVHESSLQVLTQCDLRAESWDIREDGRFALGCGEGTLRLGTAGSVPAVEVVPLDGFPSAVRLHRTSVLIGTHSGHFTVWDRERSDAPGPFRTTGCGAPAQLDVWRDRGVGRSEKGEVFTFDLESGALLDRIPGRYTGLAVMGDVLVTENAAGVHRWSLPDTSPPRMLDLTEHGGVSTFDVSRDGRMMVVGSADGSVERIDLVTGARSVLVEEGPAVVKVAFALDDGSLVFADGSRVVRQSQDGRRADVAMSSWNQAWAHWGETVWKLGGGDAVATDGRRVPGPFVDLDRGSDGPYGLRPDGEVVALHDPSRTSGLGDDVRRLAVFGERVFGLTRNALVATSWAGEQAWRVDLPIDAPIVLDADATHVVVGGRNGALVWIDAATGEERARIPDAHDRRVADIHLRDGEAFTSSWDGTIRRWTLQVPDDAAALRDRIARDSGFEAGGASAPRFRRGR